MFIKKRFKKKLHFKLFKNTKNTNKNLKKIISLQND